MEQLRDIKLKRDFTLQLRNILYLKCWTRLESKSHHKPDSLSADMQNLPWNKADGERVD